jgi:hypothetical protein
MPHCHYSDKTLETIAANIAKLMHIDKTSLTPPLPQFNVVNTPMSSGNLILPWNLSSMNVSMNFVWRERLSQPLFSTISKIIVASCRDDIMQRKYFPIYYPDTASHVTHSHD